MKNFFNKKLFWSFASTILFLPFVSVNAQKGTSPSPPPASSGSSGGSGGLTITNPLSGVDSITDLVTVIANLLLNLGIMVATVYIILSGLKFVMARGKPAELEAAKKNFLYVVIGTAILLGAKIIALALQGLIVDLGR